MQFSVEEDQMYSRQLYRTGQLMNMHRSKDLAEIPAIILPLSTTSPSFPLKPGMTEAEGGGDLKTMRF